ncbi:flavin-dependent oxidoreductase [Allomuricauda sp. NBRC 101325]|uniref:flavin-dependent oxidoreductase n=1 Tax=Allomuricauda sp. NBRC 101325 TaxID=1113758 RepID=UPI0024A17C2E|nr:flavin-dependent oxidoreductase [Muricauda sp. NBRC 101325]GLU44918.1 flavin-dependent oxidoreductase [Muricauda sp. NBRC 101325]
MKITIAGGGIGGLVTALCLNKNNYEVDVYESVDEIKPLGVGINLLPHAVRILDYLDLLPELEKFAVKTSDLIYANRYGQQFLGDKRGIHAGYKWPQFSIHRGYFQDLLYRTCLKRIGAEHIHTGHHLQSFEQDQSKITAKFINKNSQKLIKTVQSDILIGADGISSVSRQQCYPDEGPVVFSGNVLYRGTTLMKPFLNGSTMAMIGSNKQKMVVYPISHVDADSGLQLINWVSNLKEEGETRLTERDWNREIGKSFLLEKYADWTYDWLDVHQMIDKSKAIYEFPMSDRDPLETWTFGRFTMLGDAAHPMYPIGSNGASQAILDAAALTKALNSNKDLFTALRAYDQERVPATGKIVLQNRKKGPDAILDLMENRFPNGFSANEIPHDEIASTMDKYKQIAGFDIESLNQKEAQL